MWTLPESFIESEDGAVTVDWVVLTGAIVGLGLAVMTSVGGGTTTLSDKVSGNLAAADVTTSYASPAPADSNSAPPPSGRHDSYDG